MNPLPLFFPIAAQVIRQSDQDQVTVVGAGITLFEALKAYEELAKVDIKIRVVDIFTVKPIDKKTLLECVKATGGKIVTVEDHYPEGGCGGGCCVYIRTGVCGR